jgi:FMN phosphatase YigB (HAD superfamily)
MTLTLLLDLDDTLLDSNMEKFIPAYFQALSDTLKGLVSPEIMIQALLGGTKRMMGKIDPERLLSEVFDDYFYEKIGLDRDKLKPKINKFYDDIFPDLKYLTKQRQEAIDFVRWAFSKDIKVVIATNPLFPLKAIHHRLRWAGLALENYPYAMVTSYENSHFTKENISYFPEILGKLGWPDGPVIMVGNDLKMDIEPAMAAGFPVFWVKDEIDGPKEREDIPQGGINEVRSWLGVTPAESLLHSTQKPSALVATLRSLPAVLEDVFLDLNEEKMNERPNPEDWSIKEIVCHLRDVEIEVNLPRIQKVLSQENSFVTGVITDPWVVERNYAGQSGKEALRGYFKARIETIEELDNLQLEWDKPVRHSIFGSSTLLELVAVMVAHDKTHIQQIHRVKNHFHQK